MELAFWQVEAHDFVKEFSTGRTKPLVFRCAGRRVVVGDNGVGVESEQAINDDFVVKLTTGEMTTRKRLHEFVAALLAQSVNVPVVEPAFAKVAPNLLGLVPRAVGRISEDAGSGPHYASRYLGPAWNVYPPGKQLESSLLDLALRVYVFDMLIRNVDRRADRPNILTNGASVTAFDHELAFAFLYPALRNNLEPWQVEFTPATDHVFFRSLKGRTLEIARCCEEVVDIDTHTFRRIRATIPAEWPSEDMDTIESHISAVRDNASKFAEEIRRVLS